MTEHETQEIVVEALDRERRFGSREELAEHVQEILDHSGGVFDPMELACIRRLAAENGAASPEVRRIARKTTFHEPERASTGPTPFDERIQERAARLEEAEAALAEAFAERRRIEDEGREAEAELKRKLGNRTETAGGEHEVAQLRARYRTAWIEADNRVRRRRDTVVRQKAGLNALHAARRRWREERDVRFHNPDDPSSPLTLEELHERRGE